MILIVLWDTRLRYLYIKLILINLKLSLLVEWIVRVLIVRTLLLWCEVLIILFTNIIGVQLRIPEGLMRPVLVKFGIIIINQLLDGFLTFLSLATSCEVDEAELFLVKVALDHRIVNELVFRHCGDQLECGDPPRDRGLSVGHVGKLVDHPEEALHF